MNLYKLTPNSGSKKEKKRLGRGQGSGRGGTCTRGHKGAKSRSGNVKKIGFEGGQMPLQRRLPKFGFKRQSKKKYFNCINLDTIQLLLNSGRIKNKIIDRDLLLNLGIIKNKNEYIKILGRGKKINNELIIIANSFSKKAIDIINKSGSEFKILPNNNL